VHYVRAGSGAPPLVFVHGYTCDHSDWHLQLDALKARHEVIACDLRGHGATPARAHECSIEHYGGDVAALAANLELSKAVLIGHSMGCRVVLEAARLDPDRIGGLVLVDGSRQAVGDADAAERDGRAAIDRAGGYRAWVKVLVEQMFRQSSAQSQRAIERAQRLPVDIGVELRARQLRWDAAQMAAALSSVRVPLMAIQSTWINAEGRRLSLHDGESAPWLDLVRTSVPQTRIEVLAGLGHFPQLEAPGTVNRLIEEFAQHIS
jgi:pimeloyl-ACP methyl ester carboxylesterase